MKNIIASFILFIIMIFCILFSINYLQNTCSYYKNMLSALETTIKNEAWDEAYESTNILLDNWKKESKVVSIFINHVYVDGMYVELLRLTQYVNCKNKNDSLASVHSIKFLVDDIIDFEKLNIQNIF